MRWQVRWLALLLALVGMQAGLQAQEAAPLPAPLRKFTYPLVVGQRDFSLELYSDSEAEADSHAQALLATLREQQGLLDKARKVTAAARGGTVALGPEIYGLLDKLRSVCELSQGAFDPTDRPLRVLWGFIPGALAYHLPRPDEIATAKAAVGCSQMELQAVPPSLFLANPRLQLNWDLFAVGWLVDQSVSVLKDLPAAMLKSDQVAYYHGAPPDAIAWKVPVPDPRHPETTLSYLYLKNQALSILGDYQNYFLHNGIRYSSLLDVRTGYPTQENVAVQVTASSALDAELIAHATAALDDAGTQKLLKALQRSNVYKIVDRNGLLLPLSY
ncbi:MAG: FAD:protein FMN transferase [Candidatus Sericytochromatia bacterium]